MKFRSLRANEIDIRVGQAKESGLSLLLYKDSRADMNVLDETVGTMNWKREHVRDNANCIVSIWDENKKQWIGKEDTGTESYTEKEKGLASDSFKRACVNWGIGRELYTSPFIWISGYTKQYNGKWVATKKFYVSHIDVHNGEIISLKINDENHKEVFSFNSDKRTKDEKSKNTGVEMCLKNDKNKKTKEELESMSLEDIRKHYQMLV